MYAASVYYPHGVEWTFMHDCSKTCLPTCNKKSMGIFFPIRRFSMPIKISVDSEQLYYFINMAGLYRFLACVAGGLSRCGEQCSQAPFCTGGRWKTEGQWQNYGTGGVGEGVVSTITPPLPLHCNFVTSPQSPICHQYKMVNQNAHCIDWGRQLRRLADF